MVSAVSTDTQCFKIIFKRILRGKIMTSQLQWVFPLAVWAVLWTVLIDKQEIRVLVRRAKLSTFLFYYSGHFTETLATPDDDRGYFWDTLDKERSGGPFSPLTLLHFLTHTVFVAQKNNFLVISALLWVEINFSSSHNGLRVWAKKFDLLSNIYQFISPAICLFMFWLLCFFVPFHVPSDLQLYWGSTGH